ncbi:MAG: BlaI/MecI/CopY family transcriptional regulator [Planctomycetota bacterium]
MARKKKSAPKGDAISPSELEVLKILWDLEESTVRQLAEVAETQGQAWAYTTVLTLLQRLESKGFVRSERRGNANVFRSLVDRDQLLQRRLRAVAEELTGGLASPLVHALVGNGRFSDDEIADLRKLVDDLNSGDEDEARTTP